MALGRGGGVDLGTVPEALRSPPVWFTAAVTDELSKYWKAFASYSLERYAPIYNRIVVGLADDPEVMQFVASGPDDTHGPNHLQGAIHYLLLEMPDHPLRRVYDGTSDADPAPLAANFVREHADAIAALVRSRHVQTNEVGRVAVIVPALAHVAAAVDGPLSLIDVGTSAGLTQLFDRYRIEYSTVAGQVGVGPETAAVTVEAEVAGGDPTLSSPDVAWRCGVDRNPIDVTDPDQARWLRALVWPDHRERQARLDAAIATAVTAAADQPLDLRRADAVDGLAAALADAPSTTTPVVLTTWAYFYFDAETRVAFERLITDADRPVAWVSMEMAGAVPGIDVGEPPASDGEVSLMGLVSNGIAALPERAPLGWTHPHGAWFHWLT